MGAITEFGAYLVHRGLLSDGAWTRVQEVLAEARQGLAGTIAGLGLLSEKDLALALPDHCALPEVNENDWPLVPVDLPDLNSTFLRSFHILPGKDHGDVLDAIIADPTDEYAIKALTFAAGKPLSLRVATLRQIEAAITHLYFGGEVSDRHDEMDPEAIADDVDRLKELATDAPVIRFVDRMIDDALSRRASDIHVEPMSGSLKIRLRVDGLLLELPGPSRDMMAAVISRIKIMSGLDIAERRLPQDGRMRVRAHGKEIDFRVSTSPTSQGEAVVLRLLDRGAVRLEFDRLGFDDEVKRPFRHALRKPDGIVQVNGPFEPAAGEADDVVTTFYDAMRRPVYEVVGDISPVTSLGNIVSAIKGAKVGSYKHTVYDALGRPTGVTTYGYDYKNNGNAIPLPLSWVNNIYAVDGAPCSGSGKVCVTTTSDGGRTHYTYDALDRVEYTEAFVDGSVTRNRTTRTEYDPVGRVQKVWQGWGSTDEIRYQEYGYTPNGKVDWVLDANGNKTYYQYDGFDRLMRTYFPDKNRAPDPGTIGTHNPNDFEEYHYDANGNVVAKRTRKGDWIKSDYDALSRLDLKKVYQGGNWSGSTVSGGTLEASVDYSYLLDGRDDVIIQIPGSGGATVPYLSLSYGYDSAGRQTSEEITRYDNGGVVLYSRTVATELDRAGNRVQLTLPGVSAGSPSYPGVPSMVVGYGYDHRGLMTNLSADGQVIASHEYDGFGRRTGLRRKTSSAKELITNYSYETDGALSTLSHVFEQAGDFSIDFEYQRNRVNQLTRVATLNDKYHQTGRSPIGRMVLINTRRSPPTARLRRLTMTITVLWLQRVTGSIPMTLRTVLCMRRTSIQRMPLVLCMNMAPRVVVLRRC